MMLLAIAHVSNLGPFTHEVTQMLRLGNPSNDPIAFKVCWKILNWTSEL